MAVQLKNRIEKELGVVIPMASLLEGPTITEITLALLDEIALVAQGAEVNTIAVSQGESEEGEL
jgi:hypothetical protein